MKPASSSFRTSLRMKSYRSTDCLRGFWLTGLASGLIFRQCSITSLGILGICDGSHANTSAFAWRKATSASSYFSSKSPAMQVVCVESAASQMALTGTPSAPDGCTFGALGAPWYWRLRDSSLCRLGEQSLLPGRATSLRLQVRRHGHLAR
jgi:hypothetical protein